MIIGRSRFNLYLLLMLSAAIITGCASDKDKKEKQLATFRVHLETQAEDVSRSQTVPIYRAHPVDIQVEKEPFLDEAHVASARVMDVLGGFDIMVQLNRQGTWLLQEYSGGNPGKHYAIFSQFGEKGKNAEPARQRRTGDPVTSADRRKARHPEPPRARQLHHAEPRDGRPGRLRARRPSARRPGNGNRRNRYRAVRSFGTAPASSRCRGRR